MALTGIFINDDNFNISTGQNVAYIKSNSVGTANVFNFRYLMELTYKTQATPALTKTISFTQQPNDDLQGVFNVSELYKSLVTPQISASKLENISVSSPIQNSYSNIHALPVVNSTANYIFSEGLLEIVRGMEAFRGVANVLNIKFFEMYSTTATGIPVKQAGGGAGDYDVDIFLMWGRGEASEGVVVDFTDYKLVDNSSKLLTSNYNKISDELYNINIGLYEYHTISFLNKCKINTSADPVRVRISYFSTDDAVGGNIGNLIINNVSANGGGNTNTTDDELFYLFMGCGLENLQNLTTNTNIIGQLPNDVTGGRSAIKSYRFIFQDSSDAQCSAKYIFRIVNYCNQYEHPRFAYMSRFGGWEYITLNKEVTSELNVERETVTTPVILQNMGLADFSSTIPEAYNSAYPQAMATQGVMNTTIIPKETFKVFTDYLSDDRIAQIKDMMMSPQIHLLDGNKAKAVILKNANMKLKGLKNLGLYQYELSFEYANPKYSTI